MKEPTSKETGCVKAVCVLGRSSWRKKKVGDGVRTMNFVAFGVYSIGFHVSFDFIKMDILFYF
jgi:hypothetical protein